MKKVLVIFLCLLAGGLIWSQWPEYGPGYSEEQRRLWNELRSVYPVAWVLDNVSPDERMTKPLYAHIINMTGKELDAVQKIVDRAGAREKELKPSLLRNSVRSGPRYGKVDFSRADVSRLPLEGLTERELARKARAGDAEACLKMVQYLCNESDYGVIDLSWRKRREVEKWLDRAIELKRPGAEFLKNYFREVLVFKGKKILPGGGVMMGGCPEADSVAGYGEYLNCLKKGDYPLYRTAAVMLFCNDRPGEEQLMHDVLLGSAKWGDVRAQSRLAALFFEPGLNGDGYSSRGFASDIERDVQKKRDFWKRLAEKMPEFARQGFLNALDSFGFFDTNSTQTMRRYREAARYARNAARQGDLTGMYLWLRGGIAGMERFSAEEWKDIFKYDRILIESGYIPYLEYPFRKTLAHDILESFYSNGSYGSFGRGDYMASRGRKEEVAYRTKAGSIVRVAEEFNLQKAASKVRNLYLVGQTDSLLKELSGFDFEDRGLFFETGAEIQAFFRGEFEKWAEEGDLHAMYVMAGLYENGLTVPVDLGRAWELYGRVQAGAGEYPLFTVLVRDNENTYVGLLHAARFKMASMVLNHPDFPGRDDKAAYDQLVRTCLDYRAKRYGYYLLGRFHEHGVGRPVDLKKAMEFYKKGEYHKRCREAVMRLAPLLNAGKP